MRKPLIGCFVMAITMLVLIVKFHGLWESHVEETALDQIKQGNSQLKAGDPASLNRAVESFTKAAATFHGMHNALEARNEGVAQYDMAKAYAALKQYPQAIETIQRALPLFADDKAKANRADAYNLLGLYYIKTDQWDKAPEAYQKAEPLFKEVGALDQQRSVLNMLGAILYDKAVEAAEKKDWPAARDACLLAQQRYQLARNSGDEADTMHELSLVYTALGDPAKAANAIRQEKALRSSTSAAVGK